MPVEFRMESKSGNVLENTRSCSRGDSLMLAMAYDGTGRRVSKTRYSKACVSDEADGVYAADWERELVTHYTGIGTEVREKYRDGSLQNARVVVNMPQGLGRYGVENATAQNVASDFEWYLKNHLGSTMLVYATGVSADGSIKAAYDYHAFGEQVDLMQPEDKVTENFTGKEKDDETALNYFGARYLDPMIGLWISVDPKRQFSSPYLYVGNGVNPVNGVDLDGFEVSATFNRNTGLLTVTDIDTKESISGQYFSGGDYQAFGHHDKLPVGTYEILEQSKKDQWYRLEGKDGIRDDLYKGRTEIRLHPKGPLGLSKGCVTACNNDVHSRIDQMIKNTKATERVEDDAFYPKGYLQQLKEFILGKPDNSLQKYGEMEVVDE